MRKVPRASQNIAKVLPIPACIHAALCLPLAGQMLSGGLVKGNVSIDTPIMITPESQRHLFYSFRLEGFYNIYVNHVLNILTGEAQNNDPLAD